MNDRIKTSRRNFRICVTRVYIENYGLPFVAANGCALMRTAREPFFLSKYLLREFQKLQAFLKPNCNFIEIKKECRKTKTKNQKQQKKTHRNILNKACSLFNLLSVPEIVRLVQRISWHDRLV